MLKSELSSQVEKCWKISASRWRIWLIEANLVRRTEELLLTLLNQFRPLSNWPCGEIELTESQEILERHKQMSSATERLEKEYQARHRVQMDNQEVMSSTLDDPTLPADSDTTDDLSIDRDSIKRVEWVFDRILSMVPESAKGDMRVTMMKTMMKESLKDLALIPDRVFLPMVEQIGLALHFVVNGTMAELEEALAAERNYAEEG